jgi:hypothetical protein
MSAMTATAPLLDRNERRFPLAMDTAIPKIRDLYLAALESAVPEGALEARIAADRTALVQHLLEGLPGRLASKS